MTDIIKKLENRDKKLRKKIADIIHKNKLKQKEDLSSTILTREHLSLIDIPIDLMYEYMNIGFALSYHRNSKKTYTPFNETLKPGTQLQ